MGDVEMKAITIVLIGLFLISLFSFVLIKYNNMEDKMENKEGEQRLYQGPVRPTDDEEHFRKTGITRPLEVKE